MARYPFGGSLVDWTFARAEEVAGVPNLAQLVGGVQVTFWNAESGGTQYTDLLDMDGEPITYVTSSDGSDGYEIGTLPMFQGPDDIKKMWADAGGQRALMITTALDEVAEQAVEEARLATETLGDINAALAVLTEHAPVVLMHTGAGYPPKPEGFARAIRIGPTEPQSNVVDGDIWLQPAKGN